jgi:hypothetical protein
MKALGLYSAAGMAVVVTAIALAWTFLSGDGRESLLTAAVIAWPLQVGFFALLVRFQHDPSRFLIWWGAGMLGRMIVLAAVGIGLSRMGSLEPEVLVMSLAGFFFALLLLEPLFLDRGNQTARLAQ